MSRKHTSPSSICHPSHLHQRILSLAPQLLLWILLPPACSAAVGLQQRVAHAWNSVGAWHGLLIPPGKRSMCSQAFLGVLCHWSQQHIRSAPRNSWQEQSWSCVQEQLGLPGPRAGGWTPLCLWVWGEETARGKTKQNSIKNALSGTSIGTVL